VKSRPLAVIDIGSNTIRSLIVEVLSDGSYRILDDEREVARLASGLNRRKKLSSAAIQRAVDALRRMADIIRARGVRRVAVVATSAIRSAANRRLFVARVQSETGLRVRVISGKEEAHLAFESAAGSFDLAGRPCAVADVGGGSSEVILALGNHIRGIHSLSLGAVALTEEFLRSDPVKGKQFRALRAHVREQIEAGGMELEPAPQFLIASGGTATSLAQMALARQGLPGRPVQGYEMTQAELLHLRQAVLRRRLEERRAMPGLSPDRADIILAGVTILYEILDHLKVNTLKVSTRGIRHALLGRLIARSGPKSAGHPVQRQRISAAESFGRSLGFEQAHGEQVQRLSLTLFDDLQAPLGLDPGSRDLLSAAALLHDVGYVVGYRQHHKHSYHLIAHSHLDGFTPREREVIALVARYHRRSEPSKKHAEWAKLPRDDRRLVRQLSALLRIADALDRRHSRGVRELRCRVRGRRVVIELACPRDISVEIHGALDKSTCFQRVFDREIAFRPIPSRKIATTGPAAALVAASLRPRSL
jgi:exopolyphosphatase / guanosine-5'-triphosphate,3'-diphosphate pyrophosphatase